MDARSCRARYRTLAPTLTERSRRLWAATEVRALGRGGTALVAQATGISTSTITRGLRELLSRARIPVGRVRWPGAGRKRRTHPKGRIISDEQLASLHLTPHQFHPDWNYTIHPVRRP